MVKWKVPVREWTERVVEAESEDEAREKALEKSNQGIPQAMEPERLDDE